MDPYAYVGGNPETKSDPSGQMYINPAQGGGGSSVTQQQQQAYDLSYVTSKALESHGLPVGLDTYFHNHDVWTMAKAYAQSTLRTSTTKLLAVEAASLLRTDVNWNATPQMQLLYLELKGLAISLAIAAFGPGMDGGEIASAEELNALTNESARALNGDEPTSGEDVGGPCSFTPATRVATIDGKVAIGKLHVGEKVWAYNPKTHKMELQPILHVWINHDNDLVDLTITTTTRSRFSHLGTELAQTREVIHTNQKHPCSNVKNGFVSVSKITVGMHLLRADDSSGVVTGWKMVPGTQVMYNLEVAQDHTFTVGDGQWVVHNSGGGCGNGNGSIPYSTSPKVVGQMTKRGWTNDMIDDTLNNPERTVQTVDYRHLEDGSIENDPATAYYYQKGGYVVRNDLTGDIVQVSNRNDPNWIAPWDTNQVP